jgi:hypothetical protein
MTQEEAQRIINDCILEEERVIAYCIKHGREGAEIDARKHIEELKSLEGPAVLEYFESGRHLLDKMSSSS